MMRPDHNFECQSANIYWLPKCLSVCLFVWVETLRHSQQCFSHVGTEPPLPGYYQYFMGGKLPKCGVYRMGTYVRRRL